MVSSVHFLFTYTCLFECDHCFLYCSPSSKGTFTHQQMVEVFDDLKNIETLSFVYFEGGEPFLYYAQMLEGLKMAKELVVKTGIVTNGYWATSVADAEFWLRPLLEIGISDISVSNDLFHYGEEQENLAKNALDAVNRLKLPGDSICIESPTITDKKEQEKGAPVVGGGVMFRGRATETLTEGLPTKHWEEFIECPYEDLENPKRVHLDPLGHVHMCQGLSMGNIWKIPLSKLTEEYDGKTHPICGPLLKGGPAGLAREYDLFQDESFIDHCHACFTARKALIDIFPEYIAPRQVYGLS
ncbi:MAG: radical SAM protein [Candidatus Hodarchaeales archaeon]